MYLVFNYNFQQIILIIMKFSKDMLNQPILWVREANDSGV
jgi:hypothetical protein